MRIELATDNNPTEADRTYLLNKAEKYGPVSGFQFLKYVSFRSALIDFRNSCDAERFVQNFIKWQKQKKWKLKNFRKNENYTELHLETDTDIKQSDLENLMKKAWDFGSVSFFHMGKSEESITAIINFYQFSAAEHFAKYILNWRILESQQLEDQKIWAIDPTDQESNDKLLLLKSTKNINQYDLETLLKTAWDFGSVSSFNISKVSNTTEVYIEFIDATAAKQFAQTIREEKH